MSGQIQDINPPEIEIELELEKDIELEIKAKIPPAPYEKIKIMFNSIIKMRWNK